MPIHAFASWPHYGDHIAPIWESLPKGSRGQFVVGGQLQRERMRNRGIDAVLPREAGVTAEAIRTKDPIIVAGFSDLKKMGKRPVAFVEHGAGQTYVLDDGQVHGGYSGGKGRDNVGIFICPNQMVGKSNRDAYPDIPAVVVGSPRLDDLFEARTDQKYVKKDLSLAISFHWDCRIVREAGSAFKEFQIAIPKFAHRMRAYGMTVVGHGHPKAFGDLKAWWESHGIPSEKEWERIVPQIDAYVVDNSSTIFEAAALDIPVLLLESKKWRKDLEHGMRFWKHSDIGPSVAADQNIEQAFADSLDSKWADARRSAAEKIYENLPSGDRIASRYAADAILEWAKL